MILAFPGCFFDVFFEKRVTRFFPFEGLGIMVFVVIFWTLRSEGECNGHLFRFLKIFVPNIHSTVILSSSLRGFVPPHSIEKRPSRSWVFFQFIKLILRYQRTLCLMSLQRLSLLLFLCRR